MKTTDQILKIKATVLYILQNIKEGVDYIHLFKIMYFAQQEHLVRFGMPIFDDTFFARKHGPVPSCTYKTLRFAEGMSGWNVTEELKDFANTLRIEQKDGHQVVFVKDGICCDMDELSESNIEILDKWIANCKDTRPFELSELSHDNAWKQAIAETSKTGEPAKMYLYEIAKAGGAKGGTLQLIKERQETLEGLQWMI